MTVRKSQDVAREAIAKNEVVYHNEAEAQTTDYDARESEGPPPVGSLAAIAARQEKVGQAKIAKGKADAANREESEGQKTKYDHGVNGGQEPEKESSEEYTERKKREAGEKEQREAQAAKPKPLLPMPSWIDYDEQEIDVAQFLLGNGFLEPANFWVLIGASYAGKSTLSAQMSIEWAIGQSIFDIGIRRPLRTIFFQAEDSENKLRQIARICRRLNLTPEQRETVRKNTAIVTLQGVQDAAAIAEMERHAKAFGEPDIICVNPLTSFLSKGVYDEASLNDFLRGGFPAVLRRLKCGGELIHHPPKPSGKITSEQTIYEVQYTGAGMASITNACRGSLVLLPVDGDVFALCGGKGFYELGWTADKVNLKRSVDENGHWLWLPCGADQAAEANKKREERTGKQNGNSQNRKKYIPHEQILKLFKPSEKMPAAKVIELVQINLKRGENFTRDALKHLVHDKKLLKTLKKNPRGQPDVLYHLPTILEQHSDYDAYS